VAFTLAGVLEFGERLERLFGRVPGQGIGRRAGDLLVAALVFRQQADLKVVGHGLDPGHPGGRASCRHFLGVGGDLAGQGDDAILDGYADRRCVDARLPLEFRLDIPFDGEIARDESSWCSGCMVTDASTDQGAPRGRMGPPR
jgi:hypothetical protein